MAKAPPRAAAGLTIALMTALSLAPSILVMMTSFTRIVVVLSLLRTALGTVTAPPNSVVISLALFLTAFVMDPVLTKAYDAGVQPLVTNQIPVDEAFNRASVPLRGVQPSTKTKKISLNGNDTTTGGSSIMPIDIGRIAHSELRDVSSLD